MRERYHSEFEALVDNSSLLGVGEKHEAHDNTNTT